VILPQLSAVISEAEYRRLLAALSSNFGESAQSDPRVSELHQILQRITRPLPPPPASPKQAAGALPSSGPPAVPGVAKAAGGGDGVSDVGGGGGGGPLCSPVLDFTRSLRSVLAALGDSCTIQATVAMGAARLTLLAAAADGSSALAPLTAVILRDFWLGYYGTARGGMFISATLPTLDIEDLRPGVSPEQRKVLSTATAAAAAAASNGDGGDDGDASAGVAGVATRRLPSPSLLALEYRSVAATVVGSCISGGGGREAAALPGVQALKLRLQRPTLVLDFELLLQIVNFVAPSPVLKGSGPRPYETRDIFLPLHTTYYATGKDLWLSPEVRLLADAPAGGAAPPATGFLHVYDGGGGRLVLPPGLSPAESLPLIVVGSNRALRLRNVRIVNCASLPSCLSLGPGAQLQAREEDGVKFVLADPEVDRQYGAVLAAAAEAAAAAAPLSAASAATPAPTVGPLPPIFEMSFDALGASLHVIEAPIVGGGGGGGLMDEIGGEGQQARSGYGAGLESALGRGPSTTALPLARSPWQGSGGCGAPASAVPAEAAMPPHSPDAMAAVLVDAMAQRLRRRLVLQLDASARITSRGERQDAEASLRNWTMRTVTLFPAATATAASVTSATRTTAVPTATGSSLMLSKAESGVSLSGGVAKVGETPVPGAAAAPMATAAAAAGPSTTITTTLLEPADMGLRYSLSPTLQDLNLQLDSLTLRLSPAAIHLLLQLQDMVLLPLMAPPPDKPLTRCDR
ncbi:hypothetical protein VaNZ11_000962, partial [Volvox africanus]